MKISSQVEEACRTCREFDKHKSTSSAPLYFILYTAQNILPHTYLTNMRDIKSIHIGPEEYFRCNAALYPHAQAIIEDDRILSYGELDRLASRVAVQISKYDTRIEEPIGILLPKGIASIVAQIATIRVGGSCVPLDLAFPDQRIHKLYDNLKVRIVLTNSAEQHRTPSHCSTILLDDICSGDACPEILTESGTIVRTGSEHRTHVLHTSGTTGEPKGVEILSQGIIYLANNTNVIHLKRMDRVAQVAAPSFDVSLLEIWATLVVGGTIVIISQDTLMDPQALYKALQQHQVTGIIMTPTLLQHVVSAIPHAFAELDWVVTGGEAANPKVYQAVLENGAPRKLVNGYGPTECTVVATWHDTKLADCLKRTIPIGTLVDGVTLSILDEDQKPVKGSEIGELYIGGGTVARGYFNQPKLTAQRFCEIRSASGHKRRFFRTGDLARYTATGDIDFIGRNDDLVKILGKRIDISEIKAVIMDSKLAADAIVVPVSRCGKEKYLAAFVVPRERDTSSAADLYAYMKQFLPDYMVPRLDFLSVLPTTPHGKADKHLLVANHILSCEEAEKARQISKPTSESPREWLEQLWISLLGIRRVDANANFFDCGASSMQAAALLMHIRRRFDIRITMQHIYDMPVLRQLSSFIEEGLCVKSTACETHNDQSKLDILFADSELVNAVAVPATDLSGPRLLDRSHIFLTGATGFLGTHFLRDLIREPDVKEIRCLVRTIDANSGRDRLCSSLKEIGVKNVDQLQKIVVVPGVLGEENFGLSPSDFSKLAEWTDTIFHLGAYINWSQPYETHRASNVMGTMDCIQLAVTHHVKPLHYVSTAGVSGPVSAVSTQKVIMEDDDLANFTKTLSFEIGYSQSKWVADKMVRTMQKKGLPAVIYRPGFIMGDGVRGKVNQNDFMSRFFRSCLQLRARPILPGQTKVVITPDYCSAAMVHIASDAANFGHVFHITPPTREEDPDFDTIWSTLGEIGYDCPAVTYKDWVELMATDANMLENPLFSLINVLQEPVIDGLSRWELYNDMAVYDVTNSKAALADMKYKLSCGINREFLINYMRELNVKT